MIRELHFEPSAAGANVRRAHFRARASIPLAAACVVANGVRESLRELFGAACDVSLGEPVAVERDVWRVLHADACCFLTHGRQTDIVLVIAPDDARRLVARAMGEGDPSAASAGRCGGLELSTLESHALERIVTRCASAFDPLYAERRGQTVRVAPAAVPPCVEFFELLVRTPIALALGVGIVRALPDPGPSGTFPASILGRVPVDVRVELGHGTLAARELLGLAPGDIVMLQSQVGAGGCLKIADRHVASGSGGVTNGRYAFEIRTMLSTGA